MVLEDIGHFLLSKLDSERAHWIAKQAMRAGVFAPGRFRTEESKTKLFDIELDNPFGIAAGFDKYAVLQNRVRDYGFGWIESGSFTFGGGRGNRRPRLFRLEDGSMLNRMGLNNCGSALAAEEFIDAKNQDIFGVSIAKTHNPDIVGKKAIEDVVCSFALLKHFGVYTVINLSCPNTREGRTFEEPESFRELDYALRGVGKGRELVYKFSPDLDRGKLEKLVEISSGFADGYEISNTQGIEHSRYGRGGLSGPGLRKLALESVRMLRDMTDKPIIAVGGISIGKDAFELRKAGANCFLVFTGFSYKHPNNPYAGPRFAHKINEEYFELVRRESGS